MGISLFHYEWYYALFLASFFSLLAAFFSFLVLVGSFLLDFLVSILFAMVLLLTKRGSV